MSIDVWLGIDTGGPDEPSVGGDHNVTYNVSDMLDLALGFPFETLRDKSAADCIPDLERAVVHMSDPQNEPTYRAMNPPNGWGSHQGARGFLRSLLADCLAHPKATVRMWL
jgi:hypothetical protein